MSSAWGRFQSLMRTDAWVPPFIEHLTGISNQMLRTAPSAGAVMREVAQFTRGCPLVAHNAAFDRGFWQAELARAECEPDLRGARHGQRKLRQVQGRGVAKIGHRLLDRFALRGGAGLGIQGDKSALFGVRENRSQLHGKAPK